MREFRAWDKSRNRYVSEDFLNQLFLRMDGRVIWWSADGFEDITEKIDIEFYTVKKDKHDKKIYAGDIIKWTKPKPDYLLPENGVTVVKIDVLNDSIDWEFFNPSYYGEIIGNIHQNPELAPAADERGEKTGNRNTGDE